MNLENNGIQDKKTPFVSTVKKVHHIDVRGKLVSKCGCGRVCKIFHTDWQKDKDTNISDFENGSEMAMKIEFQKQRLIEANSLARNHEKRIWL